MAAINEVRRRIADHLPRQLAGITIEFVDDAAYEAKRATIYELDRLISDHRANAHWERYSRVKPRSLAGMAGFRYRNRIAMLWAPRI